MNSDKLRKMSAVEDHTREFGKMRYVYPVISRRSEGLSIGVNMNPDCRCTFDCIYCEVDRQTALTQQPEPVDIDRLKEELFFILEKAKRGELANAPRFADAKELTKVVKDIAFSGNGEPTMNLRFEQAVDAVVEVRKKLGLESESKIVLITNSSMLHLEYVIEAVECMMKSNGEVWAKLDAGTEEYFHRINRSRVPFKRILSNIEGLSTRVPVYIQTMFMKLDGEMMPEKELEAYGINLRNMVANGSKISSIQAYTIARPTFGIEKVPYTVGALSGEELEQMGDKIRVRTGLPVRCYA